jgi:oligopeptide transport system substrate-binding protein
MGLVSDETGCQVALRDEKGGSMKLRTARLGAEPTQGATRISRRDFLKIGGTGLAGAALLGTAGCGVFDQDGGQQGGGGGGNSITVNLQDSIRGLDSAANVTDEVSFNVLVNCIEGLQRLDENDRAIPGQAEDVQVSDDGLVYTFTLRDGIQWSNGDPVTSQDFSFAWLKAIDPDTGGQYAYIISQFIKGGNDFNTGPTSEDNQEEHDRLRDAVGIETPDDKTLEVTLESPAPFWQDLTAFPVYYPQNQQFVEEQGDQYAQDASAVVYNGPYTLTDFSPTQGVTFVKNEDYWDAGNVNIQRAEGKIVKEVDTAVNLHEAGDLDINLITQEYVDEYRDSPDFYQQTQFSIYYVYFNHDAVPIFRNANVRRAFQMAIDREAMAREIINDGSVPATGFVPDGIAGPGDQTFREAVGPLIPEFNPEEARRLFEQGIEETGGENPTIELLSYETSTARDIATFLQSQFEENLGAKINVNIQPFDRKLELEANSEFQMAYSGWGADYNDPMTFLDLWEDESPYNTGGYNNQRYNQLIDQAQTETDIAARMDLMQEAEVLLIEDAGVAPLYFLGRTWLVEPSIKDFYYHMYGGSLDLKLYRVEG